MKSNIENKQRMEKWHIISPDAEGFHKVIEPGSQDCKSIHIYRLNLSNGGRYALNSRELEMNGVLIKGSARIKSAKMKHDMNKLDSFYIPANTTLDITATSDIIMYIGAALYEGIGEEFFRRFEKDLPIGEIHQIHGSGVGQRDVMFTLNPEIPASRLICGLTWGGNGSWTSWPPHQHEKDLEEVYCYFDMEQPKFGLHLSYLKSGEVNDIVAHPVRSGSMVLAPCGYHPTVASPGTRNTYFWVLAAFSPSSRRYDLAVLDEQYKNT